MVPNKVMLSIAIVTALCVISIVTASGISLISAMQGAPMTTYESTIIFDLTLGVSLLAGINLSLLKD